MNRDGNLPGWGLLFTAFALALGSTLAVLYLGEVLGYAPCNLCWFQRAFMFPLTVILAIAASRSDGNVGVYALPLTAGGWLVAAYHALVFSGLIAPSLQPCGAGPSCSGDSMTILGGLPLPYLSLLAFSATGALLILHQRKATA